MAGVLSFPWFPWIFFCHFYHYEDIKTFSKLKSLQFTELEMMTSSLVMMIHQLTETEAETILPLRWR